MENSWQGCVILTTDVLIFTYPYVSIYCVRFMLFWTIASVWCFLFEEICIALVIYDYVLTLSREIEYIWFSPWNVIKILFLAQRYLPFVDVTMLSIFGPCPLMPHLPVSQFLSGSLRTSYLSRFLCNSNSRYIKLAKLALTLQPASNVWLVLISIGMGISEGLIRYQQKYRLLIKCAHSYIDTTSMGSVGTWQEARDHPTRSLHDLLD